MIARHGLVLALLGVGSGMATFVMFTHLITGLLYQVHPSDPLTLAATAALLFLVNVIASCVPHILRSPPGSNESSSGNSRAGRIPWSFSCVGGKSEGEMRTWSANCDPI